MTVRVFKDLEFHDWAHDEGVSDAVLCTAAAEIENGLVDARLGGFLIKKRVAAPGRGKRGGYRTIAAHRQGNRLFFLHGFAKNEKDNITKNIEESSTDAWRTVYEFRGYCTCPADNGKPDRGDRLRMSRILNNVHKSAKRLHDAGHLDNITMWEFDALCLPPKRILSAEDVQRIRARNQVSQAVFAAFLGVGKTTVQQWEQGLKKPSGPAAKLLDLVDRKGLSALI